MHVSISRSQRRAKGKGKDGFKRVDNPNARWFRGKGKVNVHSLRRKKFSALVLVALVGGRSVTCQEFLDLLSLSLGPATWVLSLSRRVLGVLLILCRIYSDLWCHELPIIPTVVMRTSSSSALLLMCCGLLQSHRAPNVTSGHR